MNKTFKCASCGKIGVSNRNTDTKGGRCLNCKNGSLLSINSSQLERDRSVNRSHVSTGRTSLPPNQALNNSLNTVKV